MLMATANTIYISAGGERLPLKYSISDRTLTVTRYHSGEKVTDLCAELNISKSTLYNWIKQYNITSVKTNSTPITARTVYLLEKRIKKLESELEIWKRCGCTLDSPLHEKLAAIEKLVPESGVHAPCRVLGVLRSTYYHHTLRRPEQTVIEKKMKYFVPLFRGYLKRRKAGLEQKRFGQL